MYAALSRGKPGASWSEEEFFATGVEAVREVLERARRVSPELGGRLAVEIGCGPGRNVYALAGHFASAVGYDVSPTMVRLCEENPRRPENTVFRVAGAPELAGIEDGSVDLVMTVIVMQHIAAWELIASYIRETGRALAAGGVAALHFDTRPKSLARSLYMALPDALLPYPHCRAMRRHPRPAAQIAAAIRDAGLEIASEHGPGTAMHWFICRRA